MNRFDAVLFDLDGTLLYTLPDIHAAVNAALAIHGYGANTLRQSREYVGHGSRWLIECSLPAGTDPEEVTRVLATYRACYAEHLMDRTEPYPGIEGMLSALKARGVRMGVATNKFHENAVLMMEHFFGGTIEVTQGNIAGRPPKPAPDTALAVMEALGAAPERTLLVGDSDVDALTARNTGISCVLCAWGYRERRELESFESLAVIDTPAQLPDYI